MSDTFSVELAEPMFVAEGPLLRACSSASMPLEDPNGDSDSATSFTGLSR